MSKSRLEDQRKRITLRLEHWQDNLATRVAGELRAIADEINKLGEQDMDTVEALLNRAHDQIMTGCDLMRDLRRRLQDRPEP